MFSMGAIYGTNASSRNNVRFATLDSKLERAESDLREAIERIEATRRAFVEAQATGEAFGIGEVTNLAQYSGSAIYDGVGTWITRAQERLTEAMVVGAGFEVEKG